MNLLAGFDGTRAQSVIRTVTARSSQLTLVIDLARFKLRHRVVERVTRSTRWDVCAISYMRDRVSRSPVTQMRVRYSELGD